MAHPLIHNAVVLTTENKVDCSWISLISSYLRSETLPEDRREAIKVKARATMYAFLNGVLYRRSFFEPYERCMSLDEAKRIIEKIHGGICDTHNGGQTLCHGIMT